MPADFDTLTSGQLRELADVTDKLITRDERAAAEHARQESAGGTGHGR